MPVCATIVAGERVAPELIQNAANAESIAEEIITLLTGNDLAAEIKAKLGTVREKLGGGGAQSGLPNWLSAC